MLLFSLENPGNIIKAINGQQLKKVEVKMHGTMVSVGNYFAVSEILGKTLPSWLSIVMKFFVNMHYLYGIVGFWGVANYLNHEVLYRRQSKLLVEKHWSSRMQAWWVTLLRLFLGGMWIAEGIQKINENWLSSPKLAAFLGLASDSSSSASEVAVFVKRIDEIFSFHTGIINFIVSHESKLVDNNVITTATLAKVELFHFGNFNFMPWFLSNVVLANDTVAMFFQILVVILELGVGLMLLGGAFNFIGSLISLGLLMMFVTSTGLYKETWWMIFAAVATMGGAGRAFGIDYYLLPYLNNVWDSFKKNKRFRLFFRKSLERPE
jgi:NADH dehydrogenase